MPADIRERFSRVDHRGSYLQMHFALDGIPEFAAPYELLNDPAMQSNIGIFSTPEELQQQWEDCRRGIVPADPADRAADPVGQRSRSGAAGQARGVGVLAVVPDRGEPTSSYGEMKVEMGQRVIDKITRLAPNFESLIIRHTTFTPKHMGTMFGAPGGDYCHGLIHPDQIGPNRPGPKGYVDQPIPIDGLYLASAGCHGGPGITFVPGLQRRASRRSPTRLSARFEPPDSGNPDGHGTDSCSHGTNGRHRHLSGQCAGACTPKSNESSGWRADRSILPRTDGPRPNTGRATSPIATPSTRWSPTPTWWCTSPSSSWARGRRAPGSTWQAPATCSRRRWRLHRPRRLVYTSSVAAYGYHSDNPVPITEDVPPRGSPEHYYSEQKAACEAALAEVADGSPLEVYVLRPCIVAGPKAPALAEAMPWNQLPGLVKRVAQAVPMLKPPFPDPGTPLQLVHHDDVAAAIALAATTSAPPGAYNLAGDGVVSMSDRRLKRSARRPVRVPEVAASAASEVIARMPFVPSALEWLHVGRTSVVMDTSKAKSQLGWTPKYTAAETLSALATAI